MGSLTVPAIKAAKHPGNGTRPARIGDGDGLYLQIAPAGGKSWLYRYTLGGKAREMGLGSVALTDKDEQAGGVTLARARDLAREAKAKLREGVDPINARLQAQREAAAAAKAAEARGHSFADVARDYIEAQAAGWSNAKHAAQWTTTLKTYAEPHLGKLKVAEVATADVLKVLQHDGLWTAKPETATRVRGRIEAVLDFAAVKGWREGANPARWRGHLAMLLPRRSKIAAVEHHAALAWQQAPAFLAALRGREGVAARALELAILCASRSGEVLGARWSEVDMDAALWTIPAARMKAKREHRVPLTPAALEVLHAVLPLRDAENASDDPFIFPGQRQGRPLSSMAMTMLLRKMKRPGAKQPWTDPAGEVVTAHGFRSSFRDWAGEATHHPREVIEHALAHLLKDKAEASYARGTLFEKRRALMADWAAYLAKPAAKVVTLRPKQAAAG